MKKTISILLVFAMIFMLISGMTVSAADIIAGNDVIDRPNGPDSWTDFYLADRNNIFAEDYLMTGFSAYVKEKDGAFRAFRFLVFREVDEGWAIVFESDEILPQAEGVLTVDLEDWVYVPAGSYVGLYYPGMGAVPYTATAPHFAYDTLDNVTLFTDNNNGPDFVEFLNSGNRVYSIQALGVSVPDAMWLTPIDADGYRLNVKATLPVKFMVAGNPEDVKLMINDEEIGIDFKDCEEDCDFYMGLFRPSEPGEYTATVLVNGAPVLVKDFIVYENTPNGNGQMKVKTYENAKGKDK